MRGRCVTLLFMASSGTVSAQSLTLLQAFRPSAISDDGTVLAGARAGVSARWTQGGGIQDFGREPGFSNSNRSTAVSGNGQYFAGWNGQTFPRPDNLYRWSGQGTYMALGNFANAREVFADGVSDDGNTIVGTSRTFQNTDFGAFVWTQDGGFRAVPGVDHRSEAVAVSANGSIIAGYQSGASGTEAFVWSEVRGLETLPQLPSGSRGSAAYDMSSDGRTVVGVLQMNLNVQACVWRDGTLAELGYLPGYLDSITNSVSNDGSIITGYASTINGPHGESGFVWTAETGLTGITGYLTAQGVALPAGYIFFDIKVSGDGRTFYGQYNDPRGVSGAFMATVPSPSTIAAILVPLCIVHRRRR